MNDCRHIGGHADCNPNCHLIYGSAFVTTPPPQRHLRYSYTPELRRRRLPMRVRWWLWRHRSHGTPRINTTISVPSFDPAALGILTVCPCGEAGAW